MSSVDPVSLHLTTDEDFRWFGGGPKPEGRNWSIPPGGVEAPAVVKMLRKAAANIGKCGYPGAWTIIAANQVVGLISYKSPALNGRIEIGCGIALAHRGCGFATQAVGLVASKTRLDPRVTTLVAETVRSNRASERVLEKSGFRRVDAPEVSEDRLTVWQLTL